jgi:peptidyl-tRNA hydrolase, PTH1 family
MSLFQRMPQAAEPRTYTTVGLNRTILLVGLGNPGKEYLGTRHNIGFVCLDDFVAKNTDMKAWIAKKDLKCVISSGQLGQTRVLAIKPTTFVNLSGEAVQAAINFYKIPLGQTVVIHDEIDVDFGQIRLRIGGGSAGHNGIKSVTGVIGEEYGRIRIGIGPKTPEQIDSADFVLARFSKNELAEMPALTREVSAILSEYAYGMELPTETRNFLL